ERGAAGAGGGGPVAPGAAAAAGNVSALPAPAYSAWLRGLPPGLRGALGLSDCRLEDEMSQGVEGTGLAFIVFTETMTLLPASPLWSVLFFLMLLNLGLSTMLGTVQGILTPLQDSFPALRRRRALFTGLCCLGGFALGLLFVQRSGSYFVAMFDDYAATLPLLAVVVCEAVAVAWVYGAERFLADVEAMLGRPPWRLYGFLWRYGSPAAALGLLLASLGQLCLSRPSYQAWDRDTATATQRPYPPWAVGLIVGLMAAAVLPIPLVLLRQVLRERRPGPPPAAPRARPRRRRRRRGGGGGGREPGRLAAPRQPPAAPPVAPQRPLGPPGGSAPGRGWESRKEPHWPVATGPAP
ncbi:sodium-dependent neutral amino acid transporter B(0)AT2-like, partial [Struthio camelus]|uniref:sodium-dependent neutral amino acid transporter B(0)AT2-like n=1 Tax=Struthio camelus TaxID=8801 RepID=UPI0036041FB8